MTVRRWAAVCAVVAAVLAIPSVALAQTQIRGTVKDATGGALPGVTVEAKSDVLIEGAKSSQTDGEGQYTIPGLRPGKYTVTFSLQGFQTVTNKDISVSTDVTTTVNADLKLGGRGEELTVTGAAATVDVSNATKITTLERSTLDNLPVGSNIWEMAQMIPAIDMYQDFSHRSSSVAGSLGSVQNYMSVNGQLSSNNVVMVDGMSVSGLELNGTMQAYFNNDMNSEVAYQTSGISADRSGGGVTVNMIPREGGNRFSGDFKSNYRPESWIGNNVGCNLTYTTTCNGQDSSVNTRLNSMGLNSKSSLKFLEDETISQGGPIMKNKLWFFGSWHQFRTSDYVANVIKNDGTPFDGRQNTRQGSGRLTYQMSPKLKIAGYYDRTEKFEGNMINDFDDPETSGYVRTTPNYGTGNVKATATLTSRMLVEGGYSFNREDRNDHGLDEFTFQRGTPEWYAYVRKQGSGGAVNTYGTCGLCRTWPDRNNYQGSVSYVTGAHQMKGGVQWQTGHIMTSNDGNGDSYVNYQTQQKASCPGGGNCNNSQLVADPNGVEWLLTGPTSVTAWNTPTQADSSLNKDIGVYFQDSYRYKRVTVNPGIRWEHVNSQADAANIPEGRWAPARSFKGVQNVPDWYDWAPRFNAVWDVFGNARTAVKYSVNRYNQAQATGTAQTFNTLTVTSRTLPWNDKNGNDIADGSPGFTYDANGNPTGYGPGFCTTAQYNDPTSPCEIDMTTLKSSTGALFGTPAAEQAYQGYPRSWLFENIVEVQHALTRRLSVTGSWTRSDGKDLTKTISGAMQQGDWVPYTIYNPIDGTPMTYYSIKDLATQTRQSNAAASITYVEPQRQQVNQTYSMEFRMRPYAGAQIFGGITAQRFESVNCNTSIAGYIVDPNSLRFCDSQNQSAVDDHGIFDSTRAGQTIPGTGLTSVGFTALGPIADQGGRQPLAKDFRLGVSLPLPFHGVNLGVNYLNNDEGAFQVVDPLTYTATLAGSFITTAGPTLCGSGSTRYPDGISGVCTSTTGGVPGQNDAVVIGTSNTRRIATAVSPACPTTYGCVPGSQVNPNGNTIIAPLGSTTVSRQLLPDGRLRRERLNQLDLQVSKTFRVNNFSVLPTLSVGNLFNQNKINGVSSAIYGTTGGTYAIPNSVLQARIVGVGVQVRW